MPTLSKNSGLVKAEPLTLTFRCVTQDGFGSFSNMIFPGRHELAGAPDDWPETLEKGSLNCRVIDFPENFDEIAGPGRGILKLDQGLFAPAFTIPHDAIQRNRLKPNAQEPLKGMAQVWRCVVTNETTQQTFNVFHVRRIDESSPYDGVIELMSDKHLRCAHNLQENDGTVLRIEMQGYVQP